MSTSTALITGVGGQDGVLLARHLLAEGYDVVGTVQPGDPFRFAPYLDGVTAVEQDLVDTAGFLELVRAHRPTEIYNLAGFTSVGHSWDDPDRVHEVNAASVERILDGLVGLAEPPRYFQASSSAVFGRGTANPQTEDSPHFPDNPYAESKSRAHLATAAARNDGLFACVGILYNHESVLRSPEFVTRKITQAVAEIAAGKRQTVELGNLEVSRDWGAAREYVEAMHLALRNDAPGDYVIGTGVLHTVRELVETAFEAAGLADPWEHVRLAPSLVRASDSLGLAGDPTRAREVLGWQAKVTFAELVGEMVAVDQWRLSTGLEECPDYLLRAPA